MKCQIEITLHSQKWNQNLNNRFMLHDEWSQKKTYFVLKWKLIDKRVSVVFLSSNFEVDKWG